MARLTDTGIYRLGPADGQSVMLMKAGEAGPVYQLGHAHSDFGSFELSLRGRRVFVNCGTHGYAESPHRNTLRGVAAHNVAQVSGREPLQCWSVFRVARRYAVKSIRWQSSLKGTMVRASHDGYGAYGHERVIAWAPETGWWVEDDFEGRGSVDGLSYLHLHPDFRFEGIEGGYGVVDVTDGREVARVLVPEGSSVTLTVGKAGEPLACYHPAFGVQVPASMLTFSGRDEHMLHLAYAIVPAGCAATTYDAVAEAAEVMM